MDVREIISAWLSENGYDGLRCGSCSCEASDPMPCSEPSAMCVPAKEAGK